MRPSKEEIEKILQRTISTAYTKSGREPIVDELWDLVSEWIGDAQASEFEVGYEAGYKAGQRNARARG